MKDTLIYSSSLLLITVNKGDTDLNKK